MEQRKDLLSEDEFIHWKRTTGKTLAAKCSLWKANSWSNGFYVLFMLITVSINTLFSENLDFSFLNSFQGSIFHVQVQSWLYPGFHKLSPDLKFFMTLSQGWYHLKLILVLHTPFLIRLSLSRILYLSQVCSKSLWQAVFFLHQILHLTGQKLLNKEKRITKTCNDCCAYHNLLGPSVTSLGNSTKTLCSFSKTSPK